MLPIVHRPVSVVIVPIKTVNKKPLIVKEVVHMDRQLFLPTHLLKTSAEIMFVERMWIFISPCVLDMSMQNPIPCEARYIHQYHTAKQSWRSWIPLQ
jgi:hypothetical protein